MHKMLFDIESWNEVYEAIHKNKTRTFLTMLGVAWGMFLFVGLLGSSRGMQNGFDAFLANMATNSVIVTFGNTGITYGGYKKGREVDFRLSDIEEMRHRFPEIKAIAPRNTQAATLVVYKDKQGLYHQNADYPIQNVMFEREIIEGRFINDDDIRDKSKVVVIGRDIREEIFPAGKSPLGESIKLDGTYYTVVGVYGKPSVPMEQENEMYVPFTTFQKVYNHGDVVKIIIVNIKDEYNVVDFEIRLKEFLKEQKKIHPDDTQAIISFNLGAELSKLFSFMKGMKFLAFSIGTLTLFSGVIAIASILLITVSERTHEFGIRRALGAVPSQIRLQVLLESIVLTMIAGLGGIVMATAVLALVNEKIVPSMGDDVPFLNASVDIVTLLFALGMMIVMAIVAGLIPAQRAISIKPIDALREE